MAGGSSSLSLAGISSGGESRTRIQDKKPEVYLVTEAHRIYVSDARKISLISARTTLGFPGVESTFPRMPSGLMPPMSVRAALVTFSNPKWAKNTHPGQHGGSRTAVLLDQSTKMAHHLALSLPFG